MIKGKAGESSAEYWFKINGWEMERHQSPNRLVNFGSKTIIVPLKSTGIPDYTGYENCIINSVSIPIYRAVECKEAVGETMPCSRLGNMKNTCSQNYWMSRHNPSISCFVYILWSDGTPEMHKWKPKGSYKKGSGIKAK